MLLDSNAANKRGMLKSHPDEPRCRLKSRSIVTYHAHLKPALSRALSRREVAMSCDVTVSRGTHEFELFVSEHDHAADESSVACTRKLKSRRTAPRGLNMPREREPRLRPTSRAPTTKKEAQVEESDKGWSVSALWVNPPTIYHRHHGDTGLWQRP